MLLQIEHALAQAAEVAHQVAHFRADLVRGLAHPRVFLNLLHHLDSEHQQRGRDQHDLRAVRLLDQIIEAVVQLGVYRLRWYEHQSHVLRLARQEISFRDVGHMLGDVLANTPCSGFFLLLGASVMQCRNGFERKLRVDDERTIVIR